MEEPQLTKNDIRANIFTMLDAMAPETKTEKNRLISEKLFDFANYIEAKIVLLYVNAPGEVDSRSIIEKSFDFNKIVVLPGFDATRHTMRLMKIDHPRTDLKIGSRGILEPIRTRCRTVPRDRIDIAIVPAIALDEKGSRLGTGEGYYDRLIPKLPMTTRKVALALEEQIVPHVIMESHDKHVDIIITDKRIIYKI